MNRPSFIVRSLVAMAVLGPFVGSLLGARNASSRQADADTLVTSPSRTTQATMRGIFTAFTRVYSYSLSMEYFSDPRNRETVMTSLDALVTNTAELRNHGGGLDQSFEYMREMLASDAEEALKRYEQKQYLGSQFMINKLMENCAMCHTRLPSDQAFALGSEFLERVRAQALAPIDRVNVEIAARQFGSALVTYEEILTDKRIPAEGVLLTGAVEGYLRLCVGVKNDTARPIKTLEAFALRSDVSPELKLQAEAWIRDLRSLDLSETAGREFAAARALIGDAAVSHGPSKDHSDLARMIMASALLDRYLRSLSTYDEEAAEAYYLFAVAQSHTLRSYWSGQIDFLLEQAVRSAPKAEYAREALSVLEERSKIPPPATAYEGQQVPRIDIEALRKLVEG